MKRRQFLEAGLGAALGSGACPLLLQAGALPRILRGGHPRAFFFRQSELLAASGNYSYEQWDAIFSRLGGIIGKVLDEERPDRSRRNIEYFTRFKRRHPDQLVLLHFNGNARDPNFARGKFFAGHWLYYEGCRVVNDLPAEGGLMEVRVEDAALFWTGVGRYKGRNEDIVLCRLDSRGRPDWHYAEQVELVSVNRKTNTLRVRRGSYGTVPRAFQAGKTWAAAHVSEGPWSPRGRLLWYYNHSTECPRDRHGKTCSEVLAEEIASLFLPGGALELFDGVEFDVLMHRADAAYRLLGRGVDTDGDGKPDNGFTGGRNAYGIGVIRFCRLLRERLGGRKLVLGDGFKPTHQRAFGLLNGIESEGWPALFDYEIEDWSGGLNRMFFWAENARPPVFNYVNHKFRSRGQRVAVPFRTHRLVFAAAVITGSAICYSYPPEPEPGETLGIWDELRMGTENKLQWLGQPAGPPVRLAERTPDLLGGAGNPPGAELLTRLQSDSASLELDGGAIRITASGSGRSEMRFRLRLPILKGPDLHVALTVRGEPRKGYPREMARLMWVSAAPGPARRFMTWLNEKEFCARFYFDSITAKQVTLEFTVEGVEPVWIHRVTAHAHPDAMYRVFENGLVLANPSPRPYRFDLARIARGRLFRRLSGSSRQDPETNDGTDAGPVLERPGKDALFLAARP